MKTSILDLKLLSEKGLPSKKISLKRFAAASTGCKRFRKYSFYVFEFWFFCLIFRFFFFFDFWKLTAEQPSICIRRGMAKDVWRGMVIRFINYTIRDCKGGQGLERLEGDQWVAGATGGAQTDRSIPHGLGGGAALSSFNCKAIRGKASCVCVWVREWVWESVCVNVCACSATPPPLCHPRLICKIQTVYLEICHVTLQAMRVEYSMEHIPPPPKKKEKKRKQKPPQ